MPFRGFFCRGSLASCGFVCHAGGVFCVWVGVSAASRQLVLHVVRAMLGALLSGSVVKDARRDWVVSVLFFSKFSIESA